MNSDLLSLSLFYGGAMKFETKTHYQQIPLEIVKKIAKVDARQAITDRAEPNTRVHENTIEAPSAASAAGLRIANSSFDIFLVEPNGSVLWQGLTATMEEAEQRVKELQLRSPGQYMVVSLKTGSKLLFKSDGPGVQRNESARPGI
jgi:hypothetical protein